jgi:hypothetical protein
VNISEEREEGEKGDGRPENRDLPLVMANIAVPATPTIETRSRGLKQRESI